MSEIKVVVCERWRFVGGRRRFNAERRRKAAARREELCRLCQGDPSIALFTGLLGHGGRGGLVEGLARQLGVHRTTIMRDVRWLCALGPIVNVHRRDGTTLCEIQLAYRGGPVISLTDADGKEIRGRERRDLLRRYGTRRHRLCAEPLRTRPPWRPFSAAQSEPQNSAAPLRQERGPPRHVYLAGGPTGGTGG
jgi:hypothetical protein